MTKIKNPTDFIYHYTSVAGLFGMLEQSSKDNPSLTLRATHCMFMNDPSELFYGGQLLRPIIEQVEQELSVPEGERFGRVFGNKKITQAQGVLKHQFGAPFISSFSNAKECLPMWNMYADNCKGVMIEIKSDILKKLGLSPINCKYCNTSHDLTQYIPLFKDGYSKTKSLYIDEEITQNEQRGPRLFLFYLHLSALLSALIKHPAYEYEQEVRVITRCDAEPLFREKKGVIIPYINTTIPVSAINGVYIGPNTNYELVKNSLDVFCAHKGIKINIVKSEIPYRE